MKNAVIWLVMIVILVMLVKACSSDQKCGMDMDCNGTTSSRERRLFNEGFANWKKRDK